MNNYFYLFSKNSTYLFKNYNVLIERRISIELNAEDYKRLFNNAKIDYSVIENNCYLYILKTSCDKTLYQTEYDMLFSDCNAEIHNLISSTKGIYGFSSVGQNMIIKALIFNKTEIKELPEKCTINKIYGNICWNTLEEFFEVLNLSGIKYVSLRKNEELPHRFSDNDKDIDILCNNKEKLSLIANAKKRNGGVSGYKININNEWIPFDIRFIGDNYLDAVWEYKILENRIYRNNNLYVIDDYNQSYSIIYHILTQKNSISKYYINYLNEKGISTDENSLLRMICTFLTSNNYMYHKPIDPSVFQNKRNIRYIKKNTFFLDKKRLLFLCFVSRIPGKLFLKKIKNFLISKYSV